jgi:DNA-binding transcriptional regulator/RsmH inhibitor MraZ
MTTTYEAQLLGKFFAAVETEIDTNKELVVTTLSTDYANYMARCGFIKGMRRTLEIWNEVQEAAKHDGEQKPAEQPRPKIDYEG